MAWAVGPPRGVRVRLFNRIRAVLPKTITLQKASHLWTGLANEGWDSVNP